MTVHDPAPDDLPPSVDTSRPSMAAYQRLATRFDRVLAGARAEPIVSDGRMTRHRRAGRVRA